jgi:hypothetical protein
MLPSRTANDQDVVITDFVTTLRQMFSIYEYWVPYVWAQRKFRTENYSMQSQGVLEDMFYDTLGHFLHKNAPDCSLERRSGNESWDYRYQNVGFSHKEASGPRFTAIWQPGEGHGNATPKHSTWSFAHHIVLSYFPTALRATLSWDGRSRAGKPQQNATTARTLTYDALDRARKSPRELDAVVLICDAVGNDLTVTEALTVRDWDKENLRTLQTRIRGKPPLSVSMWVVVTPKHILATGFSWAKDGPGTCLKLAASPLLSGIYVLPSSHLRDVPLQSNNKAHFPSSDFVRRQMVNALNTDHYVGIPTWPDVFAATTPPNLYQQIRNEYDLLFSARDRK